MKFVHVAWIFQGFLLENTVSFTLDFFNSDIVFLTSSNFDLT